MGSVNTPDFIQDEDKSIDVQEEYFGDIIFFVVNAFFSFCFSWYLLSIVFYNLLGYLQHYRRVSEGVFNFFEAQKQVLYPFIMQYEPAFLLLSIMTFIAYFILHRFVISHFEESDLLYKLLNFPNHTKKKRQS